ncbi:protein tincar-like [Tribolium madens]|uniref:protein tincar-like n=1 Tax=Tribolium madens TaxID=41895 RepID=UPI001CF737C5|nr:protein tincar-like [Tribolium madens]
MSSSSRSTPNIYENNNDIKAKMAEAPQPHPKPSRPKPGCCTCLHLNNLWSLWYGVFGTALQAYTAVKCVKRILGYSLLAWPENLPVPYLELNCSLGLTGAAILLLPLFLVATLFKIGNLANDGFKLGRQLSTCSKEPANEILTNNGSCRLFRHGGPTAPFVHLVIAFCLLVPKLLMEARLIEAGFLSQVLALDFKSFKSSNLDITTGQTPRCLRRADSGMPHDELTPRSDTLSTESSTSPPEPPGSNHSETSSGVHSNDSDHKTTRRATSVVDLVQNREEIQWKSSSLQRNTPNPTSTSPPPSQRIILENPAESTVVIRRKVTRPIPADVVQGVGVKEEPFGRATNMRMTSFMEKTDLGSVQASSATLPHFPTQPMQSVFAHCSTMPLPQHGGIPNGQNLVAGNSCNVYPRQHTTLPTHHNGVKLFHPQNPYITRFKCKQAEPIKTNIHEPIYTGVNKSGDMYHYNS